MIADQKIGKSFLGALNYNLKKLYLPDPQRQAEILDSNFSSKDSREIQKEVSMVKSLKPNLSRYVYHTSLNFSNKDDLDSSQMLEIAHEYLKEMGFTNNQYMIFRHYDAGHPHIHLLVNRITFDGDVVSDSNNYKKSEAILRELEYRYNLVTVEHSNHRYPDQGNSVSAKKDIPSQVYQDNNRAGDPDNIEPGISNNSISNEPGSDRKTNQHNNKSPDQYNNRTVEQSTDLSTNRNPQRSTKPYNRAAKRAPTQDELEMVDRTGKPSDKMLMQELMKNILSEKHLTLPDLIRKAEEVGVSLLFNQASTGFISGVTYFYNGFKIKGQALGNQFKWAELIKQIKYEQVRDSEAVGAANSRTKAKYGELNATAEQTAATGSRGRERSTALPENTAPNPHDSAKQSTIPGGYENENRAGGERSLAADQDADLYVDNTADRGRNSFRNPRGIQIADDVDDAALYRKKR